MTPPNPEPPSRPAGGASSRLLTALSVALIAAVAFLGWRVIRLETAIESQLERVADAQNRSERAFHLLRMESASELNGAGAVVEQISHWAPRLASSATNAPMIQQIRQRLDAALKAAEELGAEAFDRFEAAFAEEADGETRRWLMRAMLRSDLPRGKQVCALILRGTKHKPTAQTRLRAANELLDTDPYAAGVAIKDVLVLESSQGLKREVPNQLKSEYANYARLEQFPMYFHFIDAFVRSGHPDVETVLVMLLKRDDHDRMTYQECVDQLAKLGSRQCVDRIKQLFERPPFRHKDPLFQQKCLQALADIEGAAACGYFEEMLDQPQFDLVSNKLQDLLKQLRG